MNLKKVICIYLVAVDLLYACPSRVFKIDDSSKHLNYISVKINHTKEGKKTSAVIKKKNDPPNGPTVLILPILEQDIFSTMTFLDYSEMIFLNRNIIQQLGRNDIYQLSGKCCFYDEFSFKIHIYSLDIRYDIKNTAKHLAYFKNGEVIQEKLLTLKSRKIIENIVLLKSK